MERFKLFTPQKIPTGSNTSRENPSDTDEAASCSDKGLPRVHSRFEQLFLSSPRAKEIYAALNNSVPRPTPQKSALSELRAVENPTPQKSKTFRSIPGFDKVVNMASFFHNKYSHSSSSHVHSSDHLVTPGRSKSFLDLLSDKEFVNSPFQTSVNDSAIRDKVNMAISRLEEDSSAEHTLQNRYSQFNEQPSDSGVSGQAVFTDVMSKRSRITSQQGRSCQRDTRDVDNVARAQTVDRGEEIYISFETNSDDEIDVVMEDSEGAGDEHKNVRKKSSEKTFNNATVSNSGLSGMHVPAENGVKDKGDISSDPYYSVVDEIIPGTPEEIVRGRRKKGAKGQEKAERRRLYQEGSDGSSSDKTAQRSTKINILNTWSIKALKTQTHMGIIVEGQRSEDPVGEWWHSTAIVERVNARCVQTKSGSQYKLLGPINEQVTLQQGFPPDFVKAFKRGFPSNWISLVADYFNSQSSASEEEEKQTQKHLDNNKKREDLKEANHSSVTTPAETRAKRRNTASALETPENKPLPQEVEMKTTRSGRMVKPPLAWWRGQRILTDGHHNFEGIDPGLKERTPLSSMYKISIKIPITKKEKGQAVSGSENSDTLPRRRRKGKTTQNKNKSSSSTESDSNENLKRPLCFSPKKIAHKNQTLENTSPQKLPQRKSLNASKNGSQERSDANSALDGSERKDRTSKPSVREHEMLGGDVLQAPVMTPKKNTTKNALASVDRNNQKGKKKSNNEKLPTGSESQKTPSPFKRVLRSQRSTASDLTTNANSSKLSDADSEDSQRDAYPKRNPKKNASNITNLKTSESEVIVSSSEERSDNATKKGRIVNANSNNKNGGKRLMHKRFEKFVRETSTQSSEEENDRASQKQPEKEEVRLRSSISRKAKTETLSTSEKDKKVETGFKRKGKTQSGSEKVSGKKKVLKVSRQTANKDSRRRSNELPDETPLNDEEIQTMKGKLENDKRVETGSKRKGKTQSDIEQVFGKKQALVISRQAANKNLKRRSIELSDKTPSTDVELKKLIGTSNKDNSVETGSKRKEKPQSESETVSFKEQTLKVSRQTANKDSRRGNDELFDEASWTDEEIKKLNEALHSIPGNTPMFWQKISRKVGTRTAQECQSHHQGQVLVSKKNNPAAKKGSAKTKDPGQKGLAASHQNVKTVTGGVGTIKRKRELRELLEQQDVDYEDDIFDSTPFKRKKDLKLPFNLSSNGSDEENNDGDDASDTEHSTSYVTPSSRTPSSRFRPLGPLSISSTPGAEYVSPSLLQQVNRKDMDHYIYRMQQGKRGTQASEKQKSKLIRTSTPNKQLKRSNFPVIAGLDLFEVHPASDQESDDGSQDEYFSDE